MVVLPAATPVTTPVDALTVAVAVLDDVQTPPAVTSDKVVVAPSHTEVVPVIAATVGWAVTVTVVGADIIEHPLTDTSTT